MERGMEYIWLTRIQILFFFHLGAIASSHCEPVFRSWLSYIAFATTFRHTLRVSGLTTSYALSIYCPSNGYHGLGVSMSIAHAKRTYSVDA